MTIIQRPSPNHYDSRDGWKPDIIVNHITAGDAAGPALNWFANPKSQTSAHFVVDKDGTVYQCVPLELAAWGNGTDNEGPVNNAYSPLEAVRERKANANFYTVSIEHVCVSGGLLTEKQLAASIKLHKFIFAEIKRLYGLDIPVDRGHIVGHYQINPKTRPSCPGSQFPFDTIIAALRGAAYKSDTSGTVIIQQGKSYLLKITGEDIPLVAGTPGVVWLFRCRRIGEETLWHILPLPTAKDGDKVGVYYENKEKICTVQIGGI